MTEKKKLFAKRASYLVLAVIIGVVLMLGYCESANAEWAVEEQHDSNAGTTSFNNGLDRICGRYFYETGTSMYFCPLVAVGGELKRDSFEIGLTDKILPRWEAEIRLNRYDGIMDGGVGVRRVIGDGPFNLFLGASYWIDESPGSNSNMTFNLGLRYTF